jgi:surfeit locus 1 family protein
MTVARSRSSAAPAGAVSAPGEVCSWRGLIGPGIATLAALAILIGLGTWQLERLAWKENLLDQIRTRAYGAPGAIVPPGSWPNWSAAKDEFRHVQVTGTFLNEDEVPVHGIAPGTSGSPLLGYYLFAPLRLPRGEIVMVNRGFVPENLRDPASRRKSMPEGEVTVTGLVRAPESKNWFIPANRPADNEWFTRDPAAMAAAKGLTVAPFYIAADPGPDPAAWPRGGQTSLDLPNNHLQYALTWYGIAVTLAGVFGAFAWRRLTGAPDAEPLPPPDLPDSRARDASTYQHVD